jgi:hypothetical protein
MGAPLPSQPSYQPQSHPYYSGAPATYGNVPYPHHIGPHPPFQQQYQQQPYQQQQQQPPTYYGGVPPNLMMMEQPVGINGNGNVNGGGPIMVARQTSGSLSPYSSLIAQQQHHQNDIDNESSINGSNDDGSTYGAQPRSSGGIAAQRSTSKPSVRQAKKGATTTGTKQAASGSRSNAAAKNPTTNNNTNDVGDIAELERVRRHFAEYTPYTMADYKQLPAKVDLSRGLGPNITESVQAAVHFSTSHFLNEILFMDVIDMRCNNRQRSVRRLKRSPIVCVKPI